MSLSNIEEITYPPINPSGIIPAEYKVLVKVKADNKNEHGETVTDGGIILAKQTTEREEMSKVDAVIIDVGPLAFHDFAQGTGKYVPWPGREYQAGDTIIMAKFSGMLCDGEDGEVYRLINDKDIAAKRLV
jgi:chaperonin GroES